MTKKITSRPGFFGGTNHYDNSGHSYEGFFGGTNYYDNKGHKVGEAWPGFFGGTTTRLKDKK